MGSDDSPSAQSRWIGRAIFTTRMERNGCHRAPPMARQGKPSPTRTKRGESTSGTIPMAKHSNTSTTRTKSNWSPSALFPKVRQSKPSVTRTKDESRHPHSSGWHSGAILLRQGRQAAGQRCHTSRWHSGAILLDNRSRMRFLESAPRRRVSRRQNALEPGHQAKFVVFFSAIFQFSVPLRAIRSIFSTCNALCKEVF